MRVSIWDRPTRIFHWTLVLLVAAAWWTAEEEWLDWHYRVGIFILGLLIFRMLWGLVGASTARFSSFVRGPKAIITYLRGRAPPAIGHNPLGALSVIGLITLLLAVVGLGLVAADEDGLSPAPLSHLVSYDVAEAATELHEDGFDLLLVFIAIHVAAILYYTLVKRQNLIGPMVTGKGEAPDGVEGMRPAALGWLLLAVLAAGAGMWWAWSGA